MAYDFTLEEMLSLEHMTILKGGILYGDPTPAPGYDAAYRWEDEEGDVVAALVVNHEYRLVGRPAVELVVSGHVYTRYVQDKNELGKTINFLAGTCVRYAGPKSMGQFPLHAALVKK